MTAEQWAAASHSKPPKRKGTSIGLFLAIIVVIGIGTAALVQVLTPATPEPPCTTGRACSGPPAPSDGVPVDSAAPAPSATSNVPVGGTDTSPPLTTGKTWRSSDLGFSVEFDPDGWTVADEDGSGALLGGVGQLQDASLWIAATPAADGTPAQALAARVSALGDSLVGLAEDDRPESKILGPNIGYVDGVGAVYGGATDTPQGPGRRARVAVLSSTDGHLTITASLILVGGTAADWKGVRQAADSVLNTTAWSATAGGPGTVAGGPARSGAPTPSAGTRHGGRVRRERRRPWTSDRRRPTPRSS